MMDQFNHNSNWAAAESKYPIRTVTRADNAPIRITRAHAPKTIELVATASKRQSFAKEQVTVKVPGGVVSAAGNQPNKMGKARSKGRLFADLHRRRCKNSGKGGEIRQAVWPDSDAIQCVGDCPVLTTHSKITFARWHYPEHKGEER